MRTTYTTVVRPPKADWLILQSAFALLGWATRTTFVWMFQRGWNPAYVKRRISSDFGIVVRLWSGCRALAVGAAKAWCEGGKDRLARLRDRLRALEKSKEKDDLYPKRRRRNARGQRKTRAAIVALEKELAGSPRHCFGGRKLLRRNNLGEWRRRRDSEALFVGERGRVVGNQVAQWKLVPSADGSGAPTPVLSLRLPDICGQEWLTLSDVRFSPEEESILASAVQFRDPVTWRIKLLTKGRVQVCVTLEEAESPIWTSPANGAVGVDLNADHIAVADVSRDGRVLGAVRVPLGKSSHAVCDAARTIVDRGYRRGCPLVLENLDFRTKKAWLKRYGKSFARMLSNFRSRQVRDAVEREARRRGVEVRYVDPAWTSVLGRAKYMKRCRLSVHHSAALVIGRRGLGFSENLRATELALARTEKIMECASTSTPPFRVPQRLPLAWLEGGRRRKGRRVKSAVRYVRRGQSVGFSAGGGSPPAVGRA